MRHVKTEPGDGGRTTYLTFEVSEAEARTIRELLKSGKLMELGILKVEEVDPSTVKSRSKDSRGNNPEERGR
jgi:hypothetical protein